MTLGYDPEFAAALQPLLPALAAAPKPPAGDVPGRRARVDALFGALLASLPDVPDVEHSVHHCTASDGHEVAVHHVRKAGTASATGPTGAAGGPAILHIHGGGYIALRAEQFIKFLSALASQSGVQFFSVDYRLAPENPYPVPLEDCYSALLWLREHAGEVGVDPARIAVMGESAGGGLAAALALIARDRQYVPSLAKQILIYPMLDDRNLTPNPAIESLAFWNAADNVTGWGAYIGEAAGKPEGVPVYAAPARVESVAGLPPTYIDVGDLDIFREEDMRYAMRLVDAGVSCEFHLYPGVPHAFEVLGQGISVTTRSLENRLRAMMSF